MAAPAWTVSLRRLCGALTLLFAVVGCGGGGTDPTPPPATPPAAGGEFTASGVVVGLQTEPMELTLTVTIGNEGWIESILVGNGPFAFTRKVPAGADAEIRAWPGHLTPVHACRPSGVDGFAQYGYGGNTVGWVVLNAKGNLGPLFVCGPGYRLRGTGTGTPTNGRFVSLDVYADGELLSPGNHVNVPGPFLVEEGYLLPGETYSVTPLSDSCRVLNGTGVMPARDVDNLAIECGLRTVRYQVIGLVGSGLQVQLTATIPGQADLLQEVRTHEADGTFTFEQKLKVNDSYAVTVAASPTGPKQTCTVESGLGVMPDADVTDVVVRCPAMLRAWWFNGLPSTADRSGRATEGVVYDTYLYPEPSISDTRPSASLDLRHLDLDIYKNLFDLPGAQMAVYSNETGKTFWVATETPSANLGPRETVLTTNWWMRKTKDTATVKFQITHVWLDASVDGAAGLFGVDPQPYLEALAGMGLRAARIPEGATLPLSPFYWAQDVATLKATLNPVGDLAWNLKVLGEVDGPWLPLFDESMFDVQTSPAGPTGWARVSLNKEIDLVIDLSQVGPNDRVVLSMDAFAMVQNRISRESLATAYFRDPAVFDTNAPKGGITITAMDGLELVDPGVLPDDYQPTPNTAPAAACSAPASERAEVQFGAGAYTLSENDLRNRVVTITRTGSTVGEVTARLLLAPGTATADSDFTSREFFVRFASGNATPRSVTVPMIDDTAQESPETLQLSLVDVAGCADLGPQATVTLTVQDDDTPPASISTFTIGGTVTGLAGSGLTIETVSDSLPIGANGTFEFPRVFPAGYIYRVQVTQQPQNPRQACTVTNGEGTLATANVNDVQIVCTTLLDTGSLDPAFGTGGRAWLSDTRTRAHDTHLARQADGKLLAVTGGARLWRLLPDGKPDLAFGTAGDGSVTVTLGQATAFQLSGVTVLSDSRILVVGLAPVATSGRADMLVARLNANGTLDSSFAGGAGVATFDFGSWNDGASRVLVQADGSLLLAGRVSDVMGGATDFAVLKLTADGQVDSAYGSGGWARANVAGNYDVPRAAVLTPDGGVVLVGRVASSGGANADVGIVKFTAAGAVDTGFGPNGNGTVRPVTGDHEEARDIALAPDGSLLVMGEKRSGTAEAVLWLARYSAGGQLDTTFGTNGIATTATAFKGFALAVQDDGRIWVAGETHTGNSAQADYGLARFTAGGQADAGFNSGAVLALDLFGGFDTPGAMLQQPDGRLVMAGFAYNGSSLGLGLMRVLP